MPTYLTIGIIARNEEKTLPSTLSYILKQDYPLEEYVEIVIVDGASDDDTVKLSDELLRSKNIRYSILNERDFKDLKGCGYGHSRARNVVITNTSEKSNYIVRIDADCRPTRNWLSTLVNIMDTNHDNQIIGAGGTRYVEKDISGISSIEIILNYYFTSYITTLGNPAFTPRNNLKYIGSVAGYNSIYKKSILQENLYNTIYPFNTDDIEINYRLKKLGYKFLYAKDAVVYHRGAESVVEFLKQMYNYGVGVASTMLIHKDLFVRVYAIIGICYVVYTLCIPIFFVLFSILEYPYFTIFIPYCIVLFLSLLIFLEVRYKSKKISSILCIPLLFAHLFMYGWGVIYTLYKRY